MIFQSQRKYTKNMLMGRIYQKTWRLFLQWKIVIVEIEYYNSIAQQIVGNSKTRKNYAGKKRKYVTNS